MSTSVVDWNERRLDQAEAEKDIAFALVALHEGKVAKAYLNLVVAVVRLSKLLLDREWRDVWAGVEDLKARVLRAAEDQAGPEPAERETER